MLTTMQKKDTVRICPYTLPPNTLRGRGRHISAVIVEDTFCHLSFRPRARLHTESYDFGDSRSISLHRHHGSKIAATFYPSRNTCTISIHLSPQHHRLVYIWPPRIFSRCGAVYSPRGNPLREVTTLKVSLSKKLLLFNNKASSLPYTNCALAPWR